MKKVIKITLSLLFIAASFTSCVDDKDFDTPQVNEIDNDISTALLSSVKNNIINQFNADNPAPSQLIYTYPDDSPVVVAGYVVSDDSNGNYYKKMIIQDKPENPTLGIEISIDQGNLHAIYNPGRKVYIKMAGLSVGYFDGQQGNASTGYENQSNPEDGIPGIYRVGVKNDDSIDRISRTDFSKVIKRSGVTETIVPHLISDTDFSDETMNTYIMMEDIQVEINDLNKTFANEPGDAYDASRFLYDCNTENTFALMTSTFANFKSLNFSLNDFLSGKGSLKGILMKSYREENSVVVLNSYEDIDFSDTDRCDPLLLDCGDDAVGGSVIVYEENFETYADYATSFGNWTNTNVNGGNELFQVRSYSGNKYVEGSAHQSGENPLEMWLITEAIDLDNTTNEELTFKTQAHHANGVTLSVYVSTDYSGDVASASWSLVQANIGTASSTYGPWTNSGSINISCLEGNVYLAFKYTGGDGSTTTGMNIDDIKITGN
jgi:hypothetical protein